MLKSINRRFISLLAATSLSALSLGACTVGEEESRQAQNLEDGIYDARVGFEDSEIEVTIEKQGDVFLMADDIMIDKAQLLQLEGGPDTGNTSVSLNSAVIHASRHWPNGIVPYTLDPNFPHEVRTEILESMRIWESHANVKFVPRRASDLAYVTLLRNDEDICRSFIGRTGSAQELHLDDDCGKGAKLHELGHVLGFFHAQSRDDRDAFVKIHWENIKEDKLHNFYTIGETVWGAYHEATYSTTSIMHYSSHAFSSNDLPTIQKIEANGQLSNIEYPHHLDQNDIQSIVNTYGLPLPTTTSDPEPFKPAPTPTTTPEPPASVDDTCDYSNAGQNNGWGWDPVNKTSCRPR